ITVYELRAVGAPYDLVVPERLESFVELEQAIPIRYSVLAGKHMGDAEHEGLIVKLSERAAEVEAKGPATALDNLKIRILGPAGELIADDAYAKVTERDGEAGSRFLMRFTSLPEKAQAWLDAAR